MFWVGYEEVMAMKPVFWSLGTYNSRFLLLVVIGFALAIACYLYGKKYEGFDMVEASYEEYLLHKEYLFFRDLFQSLLVLYSLLVVFVVPTIIHQININEWEKSYVEDYIKNSDVVKESVINNIDSSIGDILKNDGADVTFVVNKELVSKKAKVNLDEGVVDPYITYYKNDKDFSNDYRKDEVYFVELHLPKDYKFER